MLIKKQVARLGMAYSTFNILAKNRKDTEKCYTQSGGFCGQKKSLKHSPYKKLESSLAA
jgi:hypothetical protein